MDQSLNTKNTESNSTSPSPNEISPLMTLTPISNTSPTAPEKSTSKSRKIDANAYISECCKATATKPAAGTKRSILNPETGKAEKITLGLGKWTCSGCGLKCKVTVATASIGG